MGSFDLPQEFKRLNRHSGFSEFLAQKSSETRKIVVCTYSGCDSGEVLKAFQQAKSRGSLHEDKFIPYREMKKKPRAYLHWHDSGPNTSLVSFRESRDSARQVLFNSDTCSYTCDNDLEETSSDGSRVAVETSPTIMPLSSIFDKNDTSNLVLVRSSTIGCPDKPRVYESLIQSPHIPVLRQRGGGFYGTNMDEEDTASSSYSSTNEASYHHLAKRKGVSQEHHSNNRPTEILELTPTSHEQARDTAQRELQRFVMSAKNSVPAQEFNAGKIVLAGLSERKRPAELPSKPRILDGSKSSSNPNDVEDYYSRQFKRTKKRSSLSNGTRAEERNADTKRAEKGEKRTTTSAIGENGDVQPEDVLAAREEFLRRRNAFYSRRKYVRKKIEIEVMQQQSAGLTQQNDKLRQEQVFLEQALATAKKLVDLHEKQELQPNAHAPRISSASTPAAVFDPLSYQKRSSVLSSAAAQHENQLDSQVLGRDSAATQQFQSPPATTFMISSSPPWNGGQIPDQNQFSPFLQRQHPFPSTLPQTSSNHQNNLTAVMTTGPQQVYMLAPGEPTTFPPQFVSSSATPTLLQAIPPSSAVGPRYVVPAMSPAPVGSVYTMPAPAAAFVAPNGRMYPTAVVPSQPQYTACPMVPSFNAVAPQPCPSNFYGTAGQNTTTPTTSTVLVPVLVQHPTMTLLPQTGHGQAGGQQIDVHKLTPPLGTMTTPIPLHGVHQIKHGTIMNDQLLSHRHRHNRHGSKSSPPHMHDYDRKS